MRETEILTHDLSTSLWSGDLAESGETECQFESAL